MLDYLGVGKAKKAIPLCLDFKLPGFISIGLGMMHRTVNFNDQFGSVAIEIHDEGRVGYPHLSPNFDPKLGVS